AFMDSYADAKARVPEQFNYLQRLTGDNPSQQRRLEELQQLDMQWIAWTEQQMQKDRTSTPSARDLFSGQELMEQMRQKQRVFVGEEESLRRVRSAKAKAINGVVIGSAIGLSILIGILL